MGRYWVGRWGGENGAGRREWAAGVGDMGVGRWGIDGSGEMGVVKTEWEDGGEMGVPRWK